MSNNGHSSIFKIKNFLGLSNDKVSKPKSSQNLGVKGLNPKYTGRLDSSPNPPGLVKREFGTGTAGGTASSKCIQTHKMSVGARPTCRYGNGHDKRLTTISDVNEDADPDKDCFQSSENKENHPNKMRAATRGECQETIAKTSLRPQNMNSAPSNVRQELSKFQFRRRVAVGTGAVVAPEKPQRKSVVPTKAQMIENFQEFSLAKAREAEVSSQSLGEIPVPKMRHSLKRNGACEGTITSPVSTPRPKPRTLSAQVLAEMFGRKEKVEDGESPEQTDMGSFTIITPVPKQRSDLIAKVEVAETRDQQPTCTAEE